jgi:hypothetical protein
MVWRRASAAGRAYVWLLVVSVLVLAGGWAMRGGGGELRASVAALGREVRLAASTLAGSAGPMARLRRLIEGDRWQQLIDTGDALRASGGRVVKDGVALTARTAYLLAFHAAQDAADVRRMLEAADRLQALGEHHLAELARRATLRGGAGVAAAEPQPP